MLILILGVALWWAAHLYKRVAPASRASMGERGKGMVTGLLVLSIILMVIGYRGAEGAFFWGPNPALVGINNLLVLVALYLFAASGMKTRVTAMTRHPMLWGFALWAARASAGERRHAVLHPVRRPLGLVLRRDGGDQPRQPLGPPDRTLPRPQGGDGRRRRRHRHDRDRPDPRLDRPLALRRSLTCP